MRPLLLPLLMAASTAMDNADALEEALLPAAPRETSGGRALGWLRRLRVGPPAPPGLVDVTFLSITGEEITTVTVDPAARQRVGDVEEAAATALGRQPGAVMVHNCGGGVVLASTPVQMLMGATRGDHPTGDRVLLTATLPENPCGPRERRTDQEVIWDDRERRCVNVSRPAALAASVVALWILVLLHPQLLDDVNHAPEQYRFLAALAAWLFVVGTPFCCCLATCSACCGGENSGVCDGIMDQGCCCYCLLPPQLLLWLARLVSGRPWRSA